MPTKTRGFKTKNYNCPFCKNEIETTIPTKGVVGLKGYWDTAVLCDKCKGLHFKMVWPGGRISIQKLSPHVETQ